MNYTERDLTAALRQNDQTAFDYLYKNYSNSLRIIISQIVSEEEKIADLLQDVFMKIYSKISHYDDLKASLYTWMARIARNTAIDHYRKYSKRSFQTISDQHNDIFVEASAFEVSESNDVKKQIDEVIPDRKRLLEMVYIEGYTFKEAANQLDIPEGTAKSRARSALKTLRSVYNYQLKVA